MDIPVTVSVNPNDIAALIAEAMRNVNLAQQNGTPVAQAQAQATAANLRQAQANPTTLATYQVLTEETANIQSLREGLNLAHARLDDHETRIARVERRIATLLGVQGFSSPAFLLGIVLAYIIEAGLILLLNGGWVAALLVAPGTALVIGVIAGVMGGNVRQSRENRTDGPAANNSNH